MAEFSDEDKERIVLLLARFKRPAEVVAIFKEEFGIETDVQQVRTYDPTHPRYEAGEKWRPIFEAARKEYIEDVSKVPVANQAFRLNLLQEGIEAARKAKNWKLVAELAEQASKEAGGVFTNVRELGINDNRQRARDMSSEDRLAFLAGVLTEALDKRRDAAQPAIAAAGGG